MSGAPLFDAWARFVTADVTPFTIPGHKRRAASVSDRFARLLDADVPLFGGLDEVGLTHGVLADAERRAARWWDADWLRFSTGGSTHAVQVLTLAAGRPGDSVVVTRSAHRSLLSGLVLAGLRPVWVPTRVDAATGLPMGVDVDDVRAALNTDPAPVAVFLVEPSYVGTLSDRHAVIAAAHERDVPVLVDQAWGALFGAHPELPPSALELGADAIAFSAHKTLPAFSQAAVVAACGGRLDHGRLEQAFETSATTSPAGAILASIDASRDLLETAGRSLLDALIPAVRASRRRLSESRIITAEVDDPMKIVVQASASGYDGQQLERHLLAAGVPVEQADRDTLVAIVGLLDDHSTLSRLTDALLAAADASPGFASPGFASLGDAWSAAIPLQQLTPREAFFRPRRRVPFRSAAGEVAAELIAPYPPGVPVLVPGELITVEVLDRLEAVRASGARVAYADDPGLTTLQVIR